MMRLGLPATRGTTSTTAMMVALLAVAAKVNVPDEAPFLKMLKVAEEVAATSARARGSLKDEATPVSFKVESAAKVDDVRIAGP